MVNTHALGTAQVGQAHWLRSDWWLPNGWATAVFVVLSGYGAGYLFSDRKPILVRDRTLRKRGIEILAVMFVSNILFAALREISAGNPKNIFQPDWYLGFISLKTAWTISGVLLPTALTLLVAPWVMRSFLNSPSATLVGLISIQLATAGAKAHLQIPGVDDAWISRFLLSEGFGGFPVLPFLVNGCIGIWLGMTHKFKSTEWPLILTILATLQIIIYALTFWSGTIFFSILFATVGATGKFAWMFLAAMALMRILPTRLGSAIGLIGRFALGSFIMHRVFLQILQGSLVLLASPRLTPILAYITLLTGTLSLTWLLAWLRSKISYINTGFQKIGI